MTTPTPLTRGWKHAAAATAALTGILGLIGFVNSYAAVQAAVAPSFGWWAWSIPIGIDVAIAVFSAADIVLARLNMRPRWLRLVPWAMVAATVYLNVAPETEWVGRVAHTALPLLWVIAVEVGTHAVRTWAGLAADGHMDRIRPSRWVLAPLPTLVLWRRAVLWDVLRRSEMLARERSRLLGKAGMREAYGRLWRWKAPYRARVLYRLGEPNPQPAAEGPVAPMELEFHADGTPGTAVPTVPPAIPTQFQPSSAATPIDVMATLAALVAAHPGAAAMTATELAAELAGQVPCSVGTARKYIGRIRSNGSTTPGTGAAGGTG